MPESITVRPLIGDDLHRHLSAVARLRIAVFREYPYLYDGDAAYEQKYLHTYAASLGSIIIAAFAGEEVVGAATALPLADAEPAVRQAIAGAGHNVASWLYHGESVLLPAYRGHGIGVEFFRRREAHARALGGLTHAAFCAVVRPDDHPTRPPGYQPLHAFWRRRGYQPLPGVTCSFSWREVGQAGETEHLMAFWAKELTP